MLPVFANVLLLGQNKFSTSAFHRDRLQHPFRFFDAARWSNKAYSESRKDRMNRRTAHRSGSLLHAHHYAYQTSIHAEHFRLRLRFFPLQFCISCTIAVSDVLFHHLIVETGGSTLADCIATRTNIDLFIDEETALSP